MTSMELVKQIAEKFKVLNALFDERHRRLWAATEAKAIGFGGLKIVHEATGLAKNTIRAGLEEIKPKRGRPSKKSPLASPEKVRKEGGGRKTLEEKQPGLEAALDALIAPETRGDPESPLRWTTKSTRNLVEALQEKGFKISAWSVGNLLKTMGYSLQGSVKTKEGNQHADRDLQFQYLNKKTIEFQEQNLPVISVDTKKKELIGNFKNKGVECPPPKESRTK